MLQKVHYLDPGKQNFEPLLSILEILAQLEISENAYYMALFKLKDMNLNCALNYTTKIMFVNNYFDDGFKAWQAHMDIQPIFNEYKGVA